MPTDTKPTGPDANAPDSEEKRGRGRPADPEKKAARENVKAANFRKGASAKVVAILEGIDALRKYANTRNYVYTNSNVQQMRDTIDGALNGEGGLWDAFAKHEATAPAFEFGDDSE